MRKISFLTIFIILAVALCSCTKEKGTNIVLKAAEHTELDFGYADGERTIKDFYVNDEGKVYILQKDGVVLKYGGDGKLEKEYDLKLGQQGLTACRIACGDGKIYLLDGHNNAIITAEKEEIKNVSAFDFADVGCAKTFCVAKTGVPIISFAGVDEAYTVKIDPTEANVKIIGEKRKGYLIGDNVTYLPEMVCGDDGINRVEVSVYSAKKCMDKFCVESADKDGSMVGLNIYGMCGRDYFGLLYEFVNHGETPEEEELVQTPVSINMDDEIIKKYKNQLDGNEVIGVSGAGTYCMKIFDNMLTIKPINEYFADGEICSMYLLKR